MPVLKNCQPHFRVTLIVPPALKYVQRVQRSENLHILLYFFQDKRYEWGLGVWLAGMRPRLSLTTCTMLSLTLASPSSMWPLWVPQPNMWAPQSSVCDARYTPKSNPPQGEGREKCARGSNLAWHPSGLSGKMVILGDKGSRHGFNTVDTGLKQGWNRVDLPCHIVGFSDTFKLGAIPDSTPGLFLIIFLGVTSDNAGGIMLGIKTRISICKICAPPCTFSPALGIFLNTYEKCCFWRLKTRETESWSLVKSWLWADEEETLGNDGGKWALAEDVAGVFCSWRPVINSMHDINMSLTLLLMPVISSMLPCMALTLTT